MNFLDKLIIAYLKLPNHKGKSRIEKVIRRLKRKPIYYRLDNNLNLELDIIEFAQLDIIKYDWVEPVTKNLINKLLTTGACFIDVGAHIGFYSLFASKLVGINGKVIAIEPQPENLSKLFRHIELNSINNIKPWACAVGDVHKTIEIPIQPKSDRSKLSLTKINYDIVPKYQTTLYTLSEIIAAEGIKTIDLIKIDVEGYEFEVLKGLNLELNKPKNIIIEMLPNMINTKKGIELLKYVERNNYIIKTVDGNKFVENKTTIIENNLWLKLN